MKLRSPAFENYGKIPKRYTCEGENISPPLEIIDAPKNAKSFALVMYDPDIPEIFKKQRGINGWDHWTMWDLCPPITEIKEGKIPSGAKVGINTRGNASYSGPCPPKEYKPSEHRYFFILYALDEKITLHEGAGRKELEKKMERHIIDKAELVGVYEKESE